MKKKLITISILALIIIFGVFLVFSPKQEETQGIENIKIGYLPITASLPLFVAQEKGYFLEEGINAELIKFETSNNIIEALVAEKLDLTSSVAYSTLFPVESRSPRNFKIFSGISETEDTYANFLLVKKDSDIHSISDLKNKRILTRAGIAMKTYTALVLESFNLTLDDVELQQVSPSLLVQAFNSPEIDAIYDVEPTITVILENGFGKILEENPRVKYVLNPFPVAGAVFSNKFLNENPTIAKKITGVINKAIDDIEQNPNEVKKLMVKYTPLEEDLAIKVHLYRFDKLDSINQESIQKLADIHFERGDIDNKINISTLFYKP